MSRASDILHEINEARSSWNRLGEAGRFRGPVMFPRRHLTHWVNQLEEAIELDGGTVMSPSKILLPIRFLKSAIRGESRRSAHFDGDQEVVFSPRELTELLKLMRKSQTLLDRDSATFATFDVVIDYLKGDVGLYPHGRS